MPQDLILNRQSTALLTACQATDTQLQCAGIIGPATGTPGQFRVVVDPGTPESEIMVVSAGFGTSTLTVARNVEGPALYHQPGAPVVVELTAGALNNQFLSAWLGDGVTPKVPLETGAAAQTKSGTLTVPVLDKGGWSWNPIALGADPTGVVDSTTALQQWLNSVPSQGGVLTAPGGTFKVSATLTVKPYTSFRNAIGGHHDSLGDRKGFNLFWAGATNGTVLSLFDVEYVDLDGINIDGSSIPGVTGILIDSDNAPATHNVYVENFGVSNCASAFQVGTSTTNNYQIDHLGIARGYIQNCPTGIQVQSGNAGDVSVIDGVTFHIYTTAIDLQRWGGNLTIRNCDVGPNPGAPGTFVNIAGAGGPLTIEQCFHETGSPTGLFIKATFADTSNPITLINNNVNADSDIQAARRIVSIANWNSRNFKLSGASSDVVSIEDAFLAGGAHSGGTVTYTATTVTDTAPTSTWLTNQWVGQTVTAGGSVMTITSNTATTLTGTGGWSAGTPAAGTNYTISSFGWVVTGGGVKLMRVPTDVATLASPAFTGNVTMAGALSLNTAAATDASLNLNPPTGNAARITWGENSVQSWLQYKLGGDPHLYLRDLVNGRMQMTATAGASAAAATTEFGSNVVVDASLSTGQSSTAPALATGGTITTAGVGVARVAPAAAVTGVILQAGTVAGQQVIVVNESAAANSITFAATGSNVADGSATPIAGLTARSFVWDSSTALWYRAA